MSPRIERAKPPYQQIADHLRSEIRNGSLRDGETVPSVRQLASAWDVAQGTARSALTLLRTEGLVVGVPGTGTVVRARTAHGAGIHGSAIRQTGRIYPDGQYAEIVSAAVTDTPEAVAIALGLEPGSAAIRRERITYVSVPEGEDAAASSSISWFAADLVEQAPLLLETERIRQGTFTYIGERTGRTVHEGIEERSLSTASAEEAARLGLEPGASIIRGENWMLDDEGGVLEYGQSILHPDRKVTYRFRVDRDSGTRPDDGR